MCWPTAAKERFVVRVLLIITVANRKGYRMYMAARALFTSRAERDRLCVVGVFVLHHDRDKRKGYPVAENRQLAARGTPVEAAAARASSSRRLASRLLKAPRHCTSDSSSCAASR